MGITVATASQCKVVNTQIFIIVVDLNFRSLCVCIIIRAALSLQYWSCDVVV